MNLDHLHYFEVLASTEHYGKASEILNISQPNLTYAITQLEEELGVALFEKKGRRVYLSRLGGEFLSAVKASLDILENGKRTIQENGEKGSTVLIGSIRTLGTTLLPSLMKKYNDNTTKKVKFSLHSENGFNATILKAVEDGKLDYAFTSNPGDPALFDNIAFPSSRFVVITPPCHPLSEKKEVKLEETISYPQIFFSREAGLRKVIDALFFSINAYPLRVEMESEEDDVVSSLVASGFGIAVVPYSILLKSLNVEILEITDPKSVRMAYLSRLRAKKLTPSAESFWNFSINELKEITAEN